MLRLALAEFGFQKKRALGRDDRSGLEPIDNLNAACTALAGHDGHSLEALGGFDEHDLTAFDRLHSLFRQCDAAYIAAAYWRDTRAQALTRCEAS